MTAPERTTQRLVELPHEPGVPFGHYVLHEELGKGGMAVVHRATSRRPGTAGRVVALKQLQRYDEFDVDFDQVRSLVEEARLAIRFRHPNIARTYALGKASGRYFIEMEYVPGPTLHTIAKQCGVAGPMPVGIVVEILVQLCEALEHVHDLRDDRGRSLDLVHRDVSMSNAIVSDGVVKLIDFGIVKGHSACAPTQAGTIKGKLAYVAPEYLAGQLDRRADLYAIGVMAHELLCDQRLFLSNDPDETLARIRELRVPPPSHVRPEVPAELDAVVLRALARDPKHRWQTARELREALAPFAAPGGSAAVATWVAWAFAQEARAKDTVPVAAPLPVADPVSEPTMALDLATQLVEEVPAQTVERLFPFAPAPWMLVCVLAALAACIALLAIL